MPITVPVADTELSVSTFGAPVANEVNRLTPLVDSGARAGATRSTCQSSIPNNAYTALLWSVVVADTGGFISSPQNIVIPSGKDGLYAITYSVSVSAQNTGSYMSIHAGGIRYDFNGTGSGIFVGSITVPLAAAALVYLQCWNGSGAALSVTASTLTVYRVAL